jgi:signal transduction histidine kinase
VGQPLHVLIVEDSEVDTELVVDTLQEGGFDPEYQRVERPEEFEAALKNNQWDLIISDYVMPHFSEPAAMDILKKSKKDIPFIVISGKIGEDTAVMAMKSGAHDYVMKDKLARLAPAISRELQEAKQREAKRQAEQELENFIASLTHDLRTPILAELRILELLTSGSFGQLTPEMREVIQELVRSNHFKQLMVNNILYEYKYKQRKAHLELLPVDMAAFISRYVHSIAVQSMLELKNLKIEVESIDTLSNVMMDEHEILRVLNNILKNAVHYSNRESTIIISILQSGKFVRVNIQNKGPGIDPAIEPYLFMPYTTTTAKKYHQVGLGLGLYLSKRIVVAHKGRIGYESKPGEFTVIYFELPLADNNPCGSLETAEVSKGRAVGVEAEAAVHIRKRFEQSEK